jgi:hypothetical protein
VLQGTRTRPSQHTHRATRRFAAWGITRTGKGAKAGAGTTRTRRVIGPCCLGWHGRRKQPAPPFPNKVSSGLVSSLSQALKSELASLHQSLSTSLGSGDRRVGNADGSCTPGDLTKLNLTPSQSLP